MRMSNLVALLTVLIGILVVTEGAFAGPPITLWHAYRGDEERALSELARTYQAQTGTSVDLLSVPYDAYSAKLTAAVPHGEGPDVFIDAHERIGSYEKDRVVHPLEAALVAELHRSLTPIAMQAVQYGTHHFGIPIATKSLALYINPKLLPHGAPPTLEALIGLRGTLAPHVYPLAYEAESPYQHAPILHAFGGHMLRDGDTFGFVGPEAEASVLLVRGWLRSGAVPRAADGALVTRLFVGGDAAAVISGPWLAAELPKDFHYRVVPLPRVSGEVGHAAPFLTVEAAFLTPRGRTNPEATRFAMWLADTQASLVRARVGRQVVTNLVALADPSTTEDGTLTAFVRARDHAVAMPKSPAMRATWVPTQQAIRKILRGGDVKSALSEAMRRFDDARRPPPPPSDKSPLLVVFGFVLLLGALALVRNARREPLVPRLRASLPAYAYVAHAVVVIVVLVIFPLSAGALTSLFVGTQHEPTYVGLANYVAILTARGGPLLGHGSFYLTLLVTVLWTVCNVALHVAIGMVLALLLSKPLLRFRAPYRVLLILPWAVPSYVTALAWKGMFHEQFGAINAILKSLGAEPVSFFAQFSTAFGANLATNVWLGFPFMMVVTLGALTSIPKDVLEAAEVDGATRAQTFFRVTLPLLRPTLLPSVVLGSVWTFNMFNVVFLVSGGEPDGSTDILVSEAYRWAFTRDAQYGYAAAYSVLIFLLLLAGSRIGERLAPRRLSS